MYWFGHDPQTEVGHICEICGDEHWNDGDICRRCAERMTDEEKEKEITHEYLSEDVCCNQ